MDAHLVRHRPPRGISELSDAERRSIALRYGLAVLSVCVAVVVYSVLGTHVRNNTAFLLFFGAVAFAAGYGGLGPGLVATLAATIACDFFLTQPVHMLSIAKWVQLPLSLFIIISLMICSLAQVLHASQWRALRDRAAVQAAHRRLTFLSDASMVLDRSLDYDTTLENIARLAVPRMADWCAIDVLEDDQATRILAAAHVDRSQEPLIHELAARYPLGASGQHPLLHVLRTGEPELQLDVSDAELVASARDADHLALLRALNIRSFMCVPMMARGRPQGAIMFVSSARRRYGPPDVELAQELARRAVLAVENARLYRAAQAEIEIRRRTEEMLRSNQEQVAGLNERLRRSVTETHHRVKNNLQIIVAMVDMLLMEGDELVPAAELQRLSTHIRTLAAVHDILTLASKEEGTTESVSVQAVLKKLLPLMQQIAGTSKISYQVDDALLPPHQGTSLALLVNELVSNGVKHGRGEVIVRFTRDGETATLEVCDDGPGFAPGFDSAAAANTGLELVESLSRWDLAGDLCFDTRPEGGGRVTVRFPLQAA